MSEPAIVVDHVSKRFRQYNERPSSLKERVTRRTPKRYEEFWALTDVSLTIPKGSVYGLIGHNGSGKSSLLRVMAGIHKPNKGKVTTHGRISALLELGAGFHPDLSGRENIYLNAAILGLGRKEVNGLIDDIVAFAGLEEFIDSPVKHYSSGMYVRLGFSVAVHVDPQILLIDEVIAVGDEEFQRRCFEHLNKLRRRGVTIVMVTHSLAIVQNMCDGATWLDHGVVQAQGPATDVVKQYLSEVNLHEVERLDAEIAAGVEGVAHLGADVSIERVEFLDAAGRPTPVGTSLEPMTIRVHWRAMHPIEAPLFSFALSNEGGVHVAQPGMRPTGRPSPLYTGTGCAEYRIERLLLSPGEYTLTVAVHDAKGMSQLDRAEDCAVLRVQPGNDFVYGLVDLNGSWAPLRGEQLTTPAAEAEEAAS